jgi:hypothetical protein
MQKFGDTVKRNSLLFGQKLNSYVEDIASKQGVNYNNSNSKGSKSDLIDISLSEHGTSQVKNEQLDEVRNYSEI